MWPNALLQSFVLPLDSWCFITGSNADLACGGLGTWNSNPATRFCFQVRLIYTGCREKLLETQNATTIPSHTLKIYLPNEKWLCQQFGKVVYFFLYIFFPISCNMDLFIYLFQEVLRPLHLYGLSCLVRRFLSLHCNSNSQQSQSFIAFL